MSRNIPQIRIRPATSSQGSQIEQSLTDESEDESDLRQEVKSGDESDLPDEKSRDENPPVFSENDWINFLDELAITPFQSGRVFNAKKVENEILKGVVEGSFSEFPTFPDPLEEISMMEESDQDEFFALAIKELTNKLRDISDDARSKINITSGDIKKIEQRLLEIIDDEKKAISIQNQYHRYFGKKFPKDSSELKKILEMNFSGELRNPEIANMVSKGLSAAERSVRNQETFVLKRLGDKARHTSLTNSERLMMAALQKGDLSSKISKVSVLKTFLQGVRAAQSKISNPTDLEDLARDIISRDLSFATLKILPLDLENSLPNLFKKNITKLNDQNLSFNDVDSINRNFENELSTLMDTRLRIGVDVSKSANDMLKYINDHVSNPVLKEMMLSTVNRSFVKSRMLSNIHQPLTEKSFMSMQPVRIDSSLGGDIFSLVLPEIVRLKELNSRKIPIDGIVNSLINEINDKFKNNGVSRLSPSGSRELIRIAKTGSVDSRLDRIEKVFSNISNPRMTFFRTPIKIRNDTIQRDSLVRDLRAAMASKPRGARESTLKLPHSERNMGGIKISHDKNDNKFEILIPHNVKIDKLMKIAHILAIENGIIEDGNGSLLLNIKKNNSTGEQISDGQISDGRISDGRISDGRISDILRILQNEFERHSGHDFSIIYIPKSSVGGQYLRSLLPVIARQNLRSAGGSFGGSLRNAILDRSLLSLSHYNDHPAIGGSIKPSDIFSGVSGIAGAASAFPAIAPITAPIALVSGIAGGISKMFGAGFNARNVERRTRLPQRIDEHY